MSFSSVSSNSSEVFPQATPRDFTCPHYPVRVYKSGGYWATGGYCSLEAQAFDALGHRVFDYHFNNGGSQTGASFYDDPGCGYFLMGTLVDEFSPPVTVGISWPCAILVGPGDLSNTPVAFGSNHDVSMDFYCNNEGEEPPPPYESSSFSFSSFSFSSLSSSSSSVSELCWYWWSANYYCREVNPWVIHGLQANFCSNTSFYPLGYTITQVGMGQWYVVYAQVADKCQEFGCGATPFPGPDFYSLTPELECSSESSLSLSSSLSSSSKSSLSSKSSSSDSSVSSISSSSISSISSSSVSSKSSRSSISSFSSVSSSSSMTSSSSGSSITSLSSKSSDSSQSDICTYLTDCSSLKAITSPSAGKGTSDVTFLGHFDVVDQPLAGYYSNPVDAHEQKGGLSKSLCNLGTIYAPDAGRLFSSGRGMLIMRLALPYDIREGVYEPLRGLSGRTLTDLVLWGVNFGDFYITQPGLYAAFTPNGTEFTVWTSAGKITLMDTFSNVSSGQDVVMKFCWDYSQSWLRHTVSLYVNNVVVDWSNEPILDESFSYLYPVSGGGYASANFYCMDSPSGKNSLNGTLRRLAIYRRPDEKQDIS